MAVKLGHYDTVLFLKENKMFFQKHREYIPLMFFQAERHYLGNKERRWAVISYMIAALWSSERMSEQLTPGV